MRMMVGLLATIGLLVVLVFLAAIGLFAYDEVKRRLVGDEFAADSPAETAPVDTSPAE